MYMMIMMMMMMTFQVFLKITRLSCPIVLSKVKMYVNEGTAHLHKSRSVC